LGCEVSREQLWSWIDRDASELHEHLAACAECRARASELQVEIGLLAASLSLPVPMPEKIGSYSIKRLIAEGGQALVFEAEQESPRRRVALKVLRGGPLADSHDIHLFQREIQALAHLHHPSIATIYEAGRTADGHWFIAMELVDGLPLDQYLDQAEPDLVQRIQLCRRICAAVQYAHDHGVIHRDLKPSNILVERNGTPRILDYGLARLTQTDLAQMVTRTRSGTLQGTPRYMSPEQLRGRPEAIDQRCDVYALGVLFFEVLAGQSPFLPVPGSLEEVQVLGREEPRRAGTIAPGLRGNLEAVLNKALEVDPDRRYASVRALGDDLRRHLAGEPISARHVSAFEFWARHLWKRRVSVGAGIAVVLLALVTARFRPPPAYDDQTMWQELGVAWAGLLAAPTNAERLADARSVCDKYENRPEAELLRAVLNPFRESRSYTIAWLEDRLKQDSSQWPYGLILSELVQKYSNAQVNVRLIPTPPSSDDADSWFLRARATLKAATADSCLHKALRDNPNHLPSLMCLAALSEKTGRLQDAISCARPLIERSNHKAYWTRFQGQVYVLADSMEEALNSYDRLIEMGSEEPKDYTERARVQRGLRNYEGAHNDLDVAVNMASPGRVIWAFNSRGTVNWIIGHCDEAVADYRQTCTLAGRPFYGIIRAAVIRNDQKQHEEAKNILLQVITSDSGDPPDGEIEWLHLIAKCLLGQIAPDQLVRAAEGDAKKSCEACYYAGEACRASGRFQQAVWWFLSCLNTKLEADPVTPLDPMSEFELAEWRLGLLGTQNLPR